MYHDCGPRKIISFRHFIEQLSSLFKLPHFCIAKYHCFPRTQIPIIHFIENFLGIPNSPTFYIHIRETITNENPGATQTVTLKLGFEKRVAQTLTHFLIHRDSFSFFLFLLYYDPSPLCLMVVGMQKKLPAFHRPQSTASKTTKVNALSGKLPGSWYDAQFRRKL